MALPAVAEPQAVWKPHPGQQTAFLSSPADEALFGGAAGPGKTDCLLMEAVRQVTNPAYRAILFRRNFPRLEAADGLIDRSRRWYPGLGGDYNGGKHVWTFPSGARIYFGHMQREINKYDYQGAQFSFIGFDELTEFEESQYMYLFSRNRAAVGTGLRVYIRAATNPGNIGHSWVKERFITKDIVNHMRWFAQVDEIDTEVSRDHPMARSRAFYPALLHDNPSISEDYIRALNAMADPVEKARLLVGDWDIMHTDGVIYSTFSSTENVTTDAEYNPDLPVYWGADDGYVLGGGRGHANYHPRVILFMQDNAIGGLNVFDEYYACEETHEDTLHNILDSTQYHYHQYRRPEWGYVDGSAAMFRGEIHKRGLQTINGTHKVTEGIKATRALIMTGDGIRRLLVHPRCINFIYEMGVYRSDPKGRAIEGEIVPIKIDDHGPDAVRYVIFKRRHLS